jgi:hypothetical protein
VLRRILRVALATLVIGLFCLAAFARSTPSAMHYPTGPLLTDVGGWNQPMYYSTLQTADINGDGQNEIVARGKDGLHTWELTKGAWIESGLLADLSDAHGWGEPGTYQTIQFARLQSGSQQADLLARASDGIHVWRYNQALGSWSELGAGVGSRPFADNKATATDTEWSEPAYYTGIVTGDLNQDGVAELIGRGKNGLEVYSWDPSTESWHALSQSGPLADQDGSSQSITLQMVSLSDGLSYLVARASSGIQLLQWDSGSWRTVSAGGPFAANSSASAPDLLKSVRAYVDGKGQLWLFGLQPHDSAGDASIAVYRWKAGVAGWSQAGIIPLSGHGWNRPSQYLTLRAGDFWGDGGFEIVARSASGTQVYRNFGANAANGDEGKSQWRQVDLIRDMSDGHGYSLASSYFTIQTLNITRADAGGDRPATVLLGRSPDGVEIYHNVGGRLTQMTPFPAWANANQIQAYGILSEEIGNNTSDIRSTYAAYDNGYDYWIGKQSVVSAFAGRPKGNIPVADWNAVVDQLTTEFGYVAAVRAWFQNNADVTSYIFSQAPLQLTAVSGDMTLESAAGGGNASALLNWVSLALQIASQIATVLGQPEFSEVTSLLQSGIQGAATAASGGGSKVQAKVDEIATNLGDVENQYTVQNAKQITTYVTDWGLLQQIGVGSTGSNPKYAWGESASVQELAKAEVQGAVGQKFWMYQTISNPAWHVWWCYPQQWPFGGCLASVSYDYDYVYLILQNGNGYDQYKYTAYIVINQPGIGGWPYPLFTTLDTLTGSSQGDYGQKIDDLLADCAGWNLDDPAVPTTVEPNSCPASSSSLAGEALPGTLAALSRLRDGVKSDTGTGPERPDLIVDAAIQYIEQHSKWQAAPARGAPDAADITVAEAISPTRYVDKTVPIQYLEYFIQVAQNQESRGLPLANSYTTDAYNLVGILNDDNYALTTLGSPHN